MRLDELKITYDFTKTFGKKYKNAPSLNQPIQKNVVKTKDSKPKTDLAQALEFHVFLFKNIFL